MDQKNKKDILAIVVGLLGCLLIICLIFCMGKDKHNNTENMENNTVVEDTTGTEEDNNTNEETTARYYQYIVGTSEDSPYYADSHDIELNDDGTVRWRSGGFGAGGADYKGTYTEDDEKIVLVVELDMPDGTVCDDSGLWPCNTTLTLNKNSDGTLVSVDEYGNEGLSHTYKPVSKSEANHFDNN